MGKAKQTNLAPVRVKPSDLMGGKNESLFVRQGRSMAGGAVTASPVPADTSKTHSMAKRVARTKKTG